MKACVLISLPDRRTFDRRLAKISVDIKERIAAIAVLFVKKKFVDPYIVAIDSTLLRAKGSVWHKSSMIRVVPRSGIDIDARWGFSHTKGWMDIWAQAAYNSKYWFYYYSTSISRFY